MMYVFVKKFEDGSELASIVEDPIALFKNGEYNESRGDKLYQIGPEVKVKISIVESEKVYRVPVHPLELRGVKKNLGLGDYRG